MSNDAVKSEPSPKLSDAEMDLLQRFVNLAYGGRALLLAGQRFVEHQALDKPEDTPRCSVTALVPWAAVVTSATDGHLSRALGQSNREGRRIRHLFPDEHVAESLSLRPELLPVLHVARVQDDNAADGRPANEREIRRSRRFSGTLIESLPRQLLPGYLLCIAGLTPNDLIDWQALIDVLPSVDPDNVYWFISSEEGLDINAIRTSLPNIHILPGTLAHWLVTIANQPSLAELAAPSRSLGLGDLSVEVRTKSGMRMLDFRADELREFHQHLQILGPPPRTAQFRTLSERYEHFLQTIRTPASQLDIDSDIESALFVRHRYNDLLKQVSDRVEKLISNSQRDIESDGRPTFLPIFLSGPPASGRTMGLIWLAAKLRRQRVLVARLNQTGLLPSLGAVERILRLCEQRGASVIVLLVDRLERKAVFELNQRLRSAGRHAIVVATSAPLRTGASRNGRDGDAPEFDAPRGYEIRLTDRLQPGEMEEFLHFLRRQGVPQPELTQDQLSKRYLFAWLHRLVPEARLNIEKVLLEEYDVLISGLERFIPPPNPTLGNTLKHQLVKWMSIFNYQKNIDKPDEQTNIVSSQTQSWREIVQLLPRMVLVFSCLERPLPLDLLSKRFFPALLLYHQPLFSILGEHGIIYEGELDGQPALEAHNPIVARLLLQHLIPDRTEQIRTLGQLLSVFSWNEHAYDSPAQRSLVELLKSIAPPHGAFHAEYARDQDLVALESIFKNIRESQNCRLPILLLHEGILLRELASRHKTNKSELLQRSGEVLQEANLLVHARPRSQARDHELSNILTALATTRGWQTKERAAKSGALDQAAQVLAIEAMQLATAARAYQEVYHPLDVAFWVHRDLYNHLPKSASKDEHLRLVLQMQRALDLASELGPLAPEQRSRYNERRVQLTMIEKGIHCAQSEAEALARRGDFGGLCFIARGAAIDENNQIENCDVARATLDSLVHYTPDILRDERATLLMHRLWIGQFLGQKPLDEGPHEILARSLNWALLERIVEARSGLSGSDPLPYVQFWLAVAQAHQGNLEKARRTLNDLQSQTLDYGKRRLDPLVLLCNEHEVERLPGIVRRIEAAAHGQGQGQLDVLVHIPRLGYEVIVQRRFQGTAFMNRRKGDEVEVLLGFSFWNLHGLAPDWRSTHPVKAQTPR